MGEELWVILSMSHLNYQLERGRQHSAKSTTSLPCWPISQRDVGNHLGFSSVVLGGGLGGSGCCWSQHQLWACIGGLTDLSILWWAVQLTFVSTPQFPAWNSLFQTTVITGTGQFRILKWVSNAELWGGSKCNVIIAQAKFIIQIIYSSQSWVQMIVSCARARCLTVLSSSHP